MIKVYMFSSALFLLVLSIIGYEAKNIAEQEEKLTERFHDWSRRTSKMIRVEDINEFTCTKLLVSGDAPIPDARITASSEWRNGYGPVRSRIYRTPQTIGAWCAKTNVASQWLQFDLGYVRTVTGVVTKGRSGYEQFVKSYKILYKEDGRQWTVYKDSKGVEKIFTANFDLETPKINTFWPSIRARYIRINPITWHGHVSMRADVLGCL